jgi:predicted SnoaL-like aldol condensation-catalyzing enzyme/truncated hemoglobin YjbI
MTIKEKAAAINAAVQNGDASNIDLWVADNYVQHSPLVADGKKGLLDLIDKINRREIPPPAIRTIRAMADAGFVFLHHEVHWPNRKVMFEIYRFERGLAAEHWSGIMDHPEKTASGNSMIDGEVDIRDRELTETNKLLVRAFVEAVLINRGFDRILDYYHPRIIQHNPYIDNTVKGLIDGISGLREKGIDPVIRKIHYVLGEGNFVLVLSEGEFAGKLTAFFDLFRVEKGLIAEHWDVLQEVPDTMAHTNGMFNRSLYSRLGGYDAIAGFVDLAFPRVAAHPKLEKYFIGHAMESKYRQRQLIVDKLCNVLAGPVIYIGRPLESVHRGLNITKEEWNIFMEIIGQAMEEQRLPAREQKEFAGIFEQIFRPQTVEAEMS